MFDPHITDEAFEEWLFEEAKAGRGKLVTIESQPYSKANSRRLVSGRTKLGKHYTRSIKSKKAFDFVSVAKTSKMLYGSPTPYTEDVCVYALLAYRDRRPDVDPSLVFDVLQGIAYVNDRQVRRHIIFGTIDRDRPRATVLVKPIRS